MIKRILLFTIFVSLTIGSKAQQQVSYNQYNFIPTAYNPAFVGAHDGVDVAILRNQKWQNYGEGYIANNLSVSSALFNNHGIGINLYSDFVGITSKLRAQAQYAYRLQLGEKAHLGIGVGLGIVDNRIDFSNAVVNDPNDPVLANTMQDRETMFDVTAGLQFTWAGLRIGVAAPQVLGSQLIYGDQSSSFYTLEREFVSTVGYSWLVSENLGFVINPEVLLLYTPGAPFNYNGALIFEFEKFGWIGATYKADYAVGANVGINVIKNLKLGLAYDFQIGELATFNSRPNMEILLKYNFKSGGPEPDYSPYEARIDSLNKVIVMNDEIANKKISGLNDSIVVLNDSLAKWPKEVVVDETPDLNSDLRTNSDDHFTELSGADTDNGYYVIAGAFAEKKNADAVIRKVKPKFPSARIIKNKRNELYYVMLYFSEEKGEGLAYQSYKAKTGLVEETWILYYNRQR